MTDDTTKPLGDDPTKPLDAPTWTFEREPEASVAGAPVPPPAPEPEASVAPPLRPRVRWAGIIWGLVFAAIAATLLAVLTDPARRDAATDWWTGLSPAGFALTAVIVVGALLLVAGVAGLARRASRSASER
ncbi:hypothetical protein GE115_06555 [Agromyces sp. CFH 90414]|uniref:Uncharacterized protein n=1 Tax=Agromyces agglutinans TaxID=2662258 RepID=A0A6I2FC72_9MICO|nr:hypothetical protein [Agromyces agglutinans]MRG59533.1 hypothetical protein [Agromyces agglutinans]